MHSSDSHSLHSNLNPDRLCALQFYQAEIAVLPCSTSVQGTVGWWCPIHTDTRGQAACSLSTDGAMGVPVQCRRVGPDGHQGSLPTQMVLMIFNVLFPSVSASEHLNWYFFRHVCKNSLIYSHRMWLMSVRVWLITVNKYFFLPKCVTLHLSTLFLLHLYWMATDCCETHCVSLSACQKLVTQAFISMPRNFVNALKYHACGTAVVTVAALQAECSLHFASCSQASQFLTRSPLLFSAKGSITALRVFERDCQMLFENPSM